MQEKNPDTNHILIPYIALQITSMKYPTFASSRLVIQENVLFQNLVFLARHVYTFSLNLLALLKKDVLSFTNLLEANVGYFMLVICKARYGTKI